MFKIWPTSPNGCIQKILEQECSATGDNIGWGLKNTD